MQSVRLTISSWKRRHLCYSWRWNRECCWITVASDVSITIYLFSLLLSIVFAKLVLGTVLCYWSRALYNWPPPIWTINSKAKRNRTELDPNVWIERRDEGIVPLNEKPPRTDLFTLKSYGRPDFTDNRSSYVLRANTTPKCEKLNNKRKWVARKKKITGEEKEKAIWDDKEIGVKHKGKRGVNDICMKKGCIIQY